MKMASVNRTLDGALESAIRLLQVNDAMPALLNGQHRRPELDDKLRGQQYLVAFMQQSKLRWDSVRLHLNFLPDPVPPKMELECVVDIERIRIGK